MFLLSPSGRLSDAIYGCLSFVTFPALGLNRHFRRVFPPVSLDNPSSQRFSDERGSATQTRNKYLGNELDHIINEQGSDRQFDWFVPDKAEGLTQAGLSRINQSIETFVYCVLGAQVNVRSSILGDGGRAKEAQTEFLVLLEEAIRQPNLSKSV